MELPKGWESWPPEAKKKLLDELKRALDQREFAWKCGDLDCDGLPHPAGEGKIAFDRNHARGEQLEPPGDWHVWLMLTGRGWGKTWTGAHWLRDRVEADPGEYAIVAQKYGDCRDICVEGPSGFLKALPPSDVVSYNRSLGEIIHRNGAKIHMLAADNRDTARGLNLRGAWCDEVVKWRYLETWTEGLVPAVRVGERPRIVVTTTPKPVPLIKMLVKRNDGSVHISTGSTFANIANLNPHVVAELKRQYHGTRIGRQELQGELLEDVEGALFTLGNIERNRIRRDERPEIVRRVVAVDPAVTATEASAETGIIVCSRDRDGNGYVDGDYSISAHPEKWARRVVQAYDEMHCDRVIVEVNQGGDMVKSLLRTIRPTIAVSEVRAKIGKRLRAEPIASLYEQNRIHHVGVFDKLEEQMTTWTQDDKDSPDRLDALVWGFTDLLEFSGSQRFLAALSDLCIHCSFPWPRGSIVCGNCGKSLREAS